MMNKSIFLGLALLLQTHIALATGHTGGYYLNDENGLYLCATETVNLPDDEALLSDVHFTVKNNQVYFDRQPLPKLDAATFKVVDGYYVSDKTGLYLCKVQTILEDSETMAFGGRTEQSGNYFRWSDDNSWILFECGLHKVKAVGERPTSDRN